MTEVSKERREQWKQECDATKVVWSDEPDGAEIVIHADELRALLDMADERDRYGEAVKQAKTELWRCRSDMAIMFLDDDGGIPDEGDQRRLADIEQAALACSAALEGKHD